MARFEQSIDVNVPLKTVYNQWTQFAEFPYFMEGVKSVLQKTDTKLHWTAEIAGRTEEWDAEITEQKPDSRISWRSTSGAKNDGLVTFNYMDENTTRIMLQMEYEPDGLIETVGSALGFVQRRIAGDLKNFKDFIEDRGYETGAWRGEVSRFTGQSLQVGNRYNDRALNGEASHNGSLDAASAPYVGSAVSGDSANPQTEERGERNDLGENSFTSTKSAGSVPYTPPNENWASSTEPTTPVSPSPMNDIRNSDIAPGDEPAHGYGAVEDEPQAEGWDEEEYRPTVS